MTKIKVMNETFSIQFSGKAFDNYDIPASALAQSLLALDGLVKKTAEAVYGKNVEAEVKVKAGFKQGSFIVDLIAACQDPVVATTVASSVAVIGGSVVIPSRVLFASANLPLGRRSLPLLLRKEITQ